MNRRTRRVMQGLEPSAGAPPPLRVTVAHRVCFSEVDPMGIVWHGRYANFFEEASTVLRERCGLGHAEFRAAGIMPPIARFEVEYHAPCRLDETVAVTARLHWREAARLDLTYDVRGPDGDLRTSGRTVQVFVAVAGPAPGVCYTIPGIWADCLARWRRGDFACMQG